MSNMLFEPDKESNTIKMRVGFAAERDLVWDWHTKSELLNQWWAPKPLQTKTKSMDFRDGGHWHYAMVNADKGEEYWGWMGYVSVFPKERYIALDAFCNEAGEINLELPRANWAVTFTGAGEQTTVETLVSYASLADMETVLNMGMEQGLKSAVDNLHELLEQK
jgi:uncharacterized protein YndB with AHSA1/START domain